MSCLFVQQVVKKHSITEVNGVVKGIVCPVHERGVISFCDLIPAALKGGELIEKSCDIL